MNGAQAQQKLVVYSANDSTLNDLVFDAFTKETGIEVEPVSTGSGVLVGASRPRRSTAGRHHLGRQPLAPAKPTSRYFAPYVSKIRRYPAEFRDPDDLWIGTNSISW